MSVISKSNVRDASKRKKDAEVLRCARRRNVTTTPASTSANTNAFEPENLLRADRVACGANKCFIALKSDPSVAYLVALIPQM